MRDNPNAPQLLQEGDVLVAGAEWQVLCRREASDVHDVSLTWECLNPAPCGKDLYANSSSVFILITN